MSAIKKDAAQTQTFIRESAPAVYRLCKFFGQTNWGQCIEGEEAYAGCENEILALSMAQTATGQNASLLLAMFGGNPDTKEQAQHAWAWREAMVESMACDVWRFYRKRVKRRDYKRRLWAALKIVCAHAYDEMTLEREMPSIREIGRIISPSRSQVMELEVARMAMFARRWLSAHSSALRRAWYESFFAN